MEAIKDFICIYIVNNEAIYGPIIVFTLYQLLKYLVFKLKIKETLIFFGLEVNIISINVFLNISRDQTSKFIRDYGNASHADVWVLLILIFASIITILLIQLKGSPLDVKLVNRIELILGTTLRKARRKRTKRPISFRKKMGKAVGIVELFILYTFQVIYFTLILGLGLIIFVFIATFK